MKRALGQVGRIVVGTLLGAASACIFMALHKGQCSRLGLRNNPCSARDLYTVGQTALQLRFGQDKPFLPSNATTDTGQFIDPKPFPPPNTAVTAIRKHMPNGARPLMPTPSALPGISKTQPAQRGKGNRVHAPLRRLPQPIALVSGALTKGSPIDRKFDE